MGDETWVYMYIVKMKQRSSQKVKIISETKKAWQSKSEDCAWCFLWLKFWCVMILLLYVKLN